MSFKEGFEAIEDIKNSSLKLSDTLGRIEALENKLAGLLEAQTQLERIIDRIATTLGSVENSSADLSEHYGAFTQQASSLPDQVDQTIERAEGRIKEYQSKVTTLLNELPELLEQTIEKQLQAKISDLETRLSDRLRDELKDTRQALRDAMEVNARTLEGKLETASRDIVSEMPRTLFGRRGK